jgi:hypothetical protein
MKNDEKKLNDAKKLVKAIENRQREITEPGYLERNKCLKSPFSAVGMVLVIAATGLYFMKKEFCESLINNSYDSLINNTYNSDYGFFYRHSTSVPVYYDFLTFCGPLINGLGMLCPLASAIINPSPQSKSICRVTKETLAFYLPAVIVELTSTYFGPSHADILSTIGIELKPETAKLLSDPKFVPTKGSGSASAAATVL